MTERLESEVKSKTGIKVACTFGEVEINFGDHFICNNSSVGKTGKFEVLNLTGTSGIYSPSGLFGTTSRYVQHIESKEIYEFCSDAVADFVHTYRNPGKSFKELEELANPERLESEVV